jgi:hypothetical protein
MSFLKRIINSSLSAKPGTLFLISALVALVLFQGVLLLKDARGNLIRVYREAGQHALLRGARFSHGANFAQYISFLNETVPENARVVLPPPGFGPKYIRHTPNMQFFLAPRPVINCTDLNCLENLDRANTYILSIEGFPGDFAQSLAEGEIYFDESWGVVPPEGAGTGSGTALKGFNSLFQIILAVLPPLLWLLSLAVSGFLIATYLLPRYGATTKAGLGYGLSLNIFSLALGALSLARIPINRVSALVATGVLLVTAALIGLLCTRRVDPTADPGASAQPGGRSDYFWFLSFLLLGLIAMLLGVGMGYHTTDEIVLWGAKGYGIAAMESVRNIIQWGTNTLPYPLHVPILIAGAKLLFGEALPASKMVFSGYYLALLLVIYQYLLNSGIRRIMAGLSVLLIGTLPIVFRHATIAYANLPMSFYFVGAALLLVHSLEKTNNRLETREAFLCGVFFACAAWTRPEGLIMAWLAIGFILAARYCMTRRWISIRFLLYLLGPLAVYSLFWLVFKYSIYSEMPNRMDLVSRALSHISRGSLHLNEALYVLGATIKRPLDYQTWGALGLGLIIIVISLFQARSSNQPGSLVLLTGLFVTGITVGIYYLASFDQVHDISWWISTGYDRMLLPGILLILVGGIILIGKSLTGKEKHSSPYEPL